MNNTGVKFITSKADSSLIIQIAKRAAKICAERNIRRDALNFAMDLSACHLNGNALDLQRLLDADDANFAHDIFGIARHLDRDTGMLTNHFRPRFATA